MDLRDKNKLQLQRLFIERYNHYLEASKYHTFGAPKTEAHLLTKKNLDEVIEALTQRKAKTRQPDGA